MNEENRWRLWALFHGDPWDWPEADVLNALTHMWRVRLFVLGQETPESVALETVMEKVNDA
jgi:hypothetical protein